MRLSAIFLFLSVFFFSSFAVGQALIDSKEAINSGIKLYDSENYDEALLEFEKVNKFDTNYQWAVYEMALTNLKLKRYEESERLARLALKLKEDYVEAYTCLGNALDEQGKLEEALVAYDEGIAKYPYNHLLWFNKAVLYEQNEDYAEAFKIYKHLLEFNPVFSSTHLRLGIMCANEGLLSQSLMAFTTFLLLEPASGRSLNILGYANRLSSGGVQEAGSREKKELENSMEDLDFLVSNKVALNKKYKTPSKITFDLVKQVHMLLEQCSKNKINGFWGEFYVPIYQKVRAENKFEDMALLMCASTTNEQVKKYIEKDLNDIKEFSTWWNNAWYDQHKQIKNSNGENKTAFYYNRYLNGLGDVTPEGEQTGEMVYYNSSGSLKSYGTLNSESEREGQWVFLFPSGDTNQILDYKNGKANGPFKFFYLGNRVNEIGTYKEGKLDGLYETFHKSGNRSIVENYADGKTIGEGKRYHPNGKVEYEYTHKLGELEGTLKVYYANGTLADEKFFVEGELQGERKQYFEDGSLSKVQSYEQGVLEGPYRTYHNNGQLESEGAAVKGNVAGEWKYYYSDGELSKLSTYGENGKITGLEESYDFSGKLLHKREFVKGVLESIEYFDENGTKAYEASLSKGKIYVKNFTANRCLDNEGLIENDELEGEWKSYFKSGALSYSKQYKDGVQLGVEKSFYENGIAEYSIDYVDGEIEGPYEKQNRFETKKETGNYVKGLREGIWFQYYPNGEISEQIFYAKGKRYQDNVEYWLNGKIHTRNVYDKQGETIGLAHYDTNGVFVDSSGIEFGTGTISIKFANGKTDFEGHYIDGKAHGDFSWYFPNGKVSAKGRIEMDNRVGSWQWYYGIGVKREEGSYHNGNKQGTWTTYFLDGTVNDISVYQFGKLHGVAKSYYLDGSLEYERDYYEGRYHGESRFYAPVSGELKIVRYYSHGLLIGYSYMGSDKKLIPMIPIENESAEITAYYWSGGKSVDYTIKNGLFHGKSMHWDPSGKVLREGVYVHDEREGEYKIYHFNGKLNSTQEYKNGDANGSYSSYHSNGKLSVTGFYTHGLAHGDWTYYDKTGKKMMTQVYNSGTVVQYK